MATYLCILAGGRSSRFGQSKLRVQIDGKPILPWLIERHKDLNPDGCWLSLGPDQPLPAGAEVFDKIIRDEQAHQGPLHGLKAILAEGEPEDLVVLLPADMPLIPTDYLIVLLNCLGLSQDQAGIMAKWAMGDLTGQIEPLPSAWRVRTARIVVDQAIGRGLGGPSQMADYPGIGKTFLHWEEEQKPQFLSFNRQKDLPQISELLNATLSVGKPH